MHGEGIRRTSAIKSVDVSKQNIELYDGIAFQYDSGVLIGEKKERLGGIFSLFPTQNVSDEDLGHWEVVKYKVQKGDTLQKIAERFNISVDTIQKANGGISKVKKGNELIILPVSGELYTTKTGETLAGIAYTMNISLDEIKKYNSVYSDVPVIPEGTILIVPAGGEIKIASSTLPLLKGFFTLPADGWNWGVLHEENAIDITGKCGSDVRASAEGVVVKDDLYGNGKDGWNGGYGKFVLIEHKSGVRTRYAHLDTIRIDVGDVVKQGDIIGFMGKTGGNEDLSGCFVHFEIIGAQNEFGK